MQQQQQQQPMLPMLPSFPSTNITTEQIQKYLDENKKLILAILDNQNLGKLAECAQFQAQLQKNLIYLAAIADAQPQAPAAPPQIPPHLAMQHGGHYMQHPQATLAQQQGVFVPKVPVQFNPHQFQDHHQHHHHQQAIEGHMGMRPGANNGIHPMHREANLGGGPPPSAGVNEFTRGAGGGASSSSVDVQGGNKQDASESGSGDGQGNPAAGNSGGDREPSYLKGSGDAN